MAERLINIAQGDIVNVINHGDPSKIHQEIIIDPGEARDMTQASRILQEDPLILSSLGTVYDGEIVSRRRGRKISSSNIASALKRAMPYLANAVSKTVEQGKQRKPRTLSRS